MGKAISNIFGGGSLPDTGPTAAELEAERKADEKRAKLTDDRQEQQARDKQAKTRAAWKRAGARSTMATGSQGLLTSADTASGGLKDTLGG